MDEILYFKSFLTTRKKNFFHQLIIEFVNWLELNYQKYKNGTVGDENYKGNLSLPTKDFVSFRTDRKSIFNVKNILKRGDRQHQNETF